MLCRVCLENEGEEIVVNGETYLEFCSKMCHYESLKVPLAAVWERDNGICHLCGNYVHYEQASRDHLIPKFNGGPTTFDNVALAHKKCNSKRGTAPIDEFKRRQYVGEVSADGKL
jgi:hypothetical protein